MEPPAKKPRLTKDTCGDAIQPDTALRGYHSCSRPLNSFEGYGVQNTGNIKVSRDFILNVNESSKTSVEVDKHQILLESLRFDQMDTRQLTIKKAHAHTCAWFLNTPPYTNWTKKNTMRNDHNFLWIKGKPGAGKSTLMKFLLGKLRNQVRQARNREVLLSFFFNARGSNLEKTTTGLYRSLLLQLLEARPDLRYILDSIRIGHHWTIESLKSLFEEALQGLGDTSVVCLIDALDECEVAQIRDMVFFLSDPGVISNQFRLCFASRHYPHITINRGLSIVLEAQLGHGKDIETYLHSALVIQDSVLAEQIRHDLQKKALGVFMWVVLVVDILNKEYDAGREYVLRERIQQLPGDLHDLFLNILTRDDNNMDGLLLCTQWVLFARQPLTPKQLYYAILSGLEPEKLPDCHSDRISEDSIKRYILNNSKGLAESTKSESPTIQFIHESVRDFLLKENGFSRIWPRISTNVFGLSHNMLKRCCQTYMSMQEVADYRGPPSREAVALRFPFLDYAQREILYHANQAQSYNVCQKGFLAKFPLSEWVKHHNIFSKKKAWLYTSNVSLFYILAEAGMAALIRAQPNRQSCFKVEDERYGLPILAASATKSSEAVQTMLDLEAERLSESSLAKLSSMMPPNLDISYASGRNFRFSKSRDLFHQLVEYGNEKASIFFLAVRECNINVKNPQGKPALMSAVEKGFAALVEALLHKGADILAANNKGLTTLHIALSSRHVDIFKLLTDHCVKLPASGESGKSLLCTVLKPGYIEIAKLLIESGADISASGEYGKSPLHIAIERGYIEIAKLLIDRGANISASGEYGKSPLHIAIECGYIEIAELLIDRGANISASGEYGKSLLYIAIECGYIEIAKLLIDRGANISASGEYGKSPLHIAIERGYIEIAKLLIDRGANISASGEYGKSPLHIAIECGHIEIAELLIESGADISAADDCGYTLLLLAASDGYIEVAKLLIESGAVISTANSIGETPLLSALSRGHIEVAKLLIESGADISTADSIGQTPLLLALYQDHIEIVKLLIKSGANISAANSFGQTPLLVALFRGYIEVVKLLIESGVDVSMNTTGWPPLHTAILQGRLEVAKLLIESGADVSAANDFGETPLALASSVADAEVVKMLLDRGARFPESSSD